MIELGMNQTLIVMRDSSIGIFLNEDGGHEDNDILLPKNQVPDGIKAGDEIDVFVYRDSEDRMIATRKTPKIVMGEIAVLKVVEVTPIGAFLDWGLEKDLFLPFKEQPNKVERGRSYLVGLYLDNSERLCATMNITRYLEEKSDYEKNDTVSGIIYAISEDVGAFVAIDNKYIGLIPKKEFYGNYKCGDTVEGRVANIKEDGKIDIGLRQVSYKQMDVDAELILAKLEENDGFLNLNDKSSPEDINEELKMSKKAFKRAIGRLWKEKKIDLVDDGIKLLENKEEAKEETKED